MNEQETPAPIVGKLALEERLRSLGAFLRQHRPLWEERPFVAMPPTWQERWPDLAAWLCTLPAATIDAIESEEQTLASLAVRPLGGWIAQMGALTAVGQLPSRPLQRAQEGFRRQVKARKWDQISSFVGVAMALPIPSATRWLDWCGGKGHLGRLAALETGLPVTHLERQLRLCEQGAELDQRDGVQGHFVCADALAETSADLTGEGVAALGLHACGSLGERLLTLCRDGGASSVLLAPCCHHVVADRGDYRPLSQSAQADDLDLTRWNLRLATSDEVISSPARRQRRRLVMERRLAVDLLMRRLTGDDVYRSPGPLPPGLLTGPLAELCAEVARRRQVGLPADVDWLELEEQGRRRAHQVRALGLVRGVFRRGLEMWVDLDRACYMADAGWQVQLGTFCPRRWTPRNLVVAAWRL